MTPTMNLIRCARCNRILGDYRMTEGEIRIRCVRSGCKKENIIRVSKLQIEEDRAK